MASRVNYLVLTGLFVVSGFSATGRADFIVNSTSGSGNLSNILFSPSSPAGMTQTGQVISMGPSGLFVDFMSNVSIETQGSNKLTPSSGTSLGSVIMVSPNNFFGWSGGTSTAQGSSRLVSINLDATGIAANGDDLSVTLEAVDSVGNAITTGLDFLVELENENPARVDINADDGEILTKVTFETLNGAVITQIKQPRVTDEVVMKPPGTEPPTNPTAAPEPSSILVWLAAGLGLALWSRKRTNRV